MFRRFPALFSLKRPRLVSLVTTVLFAGAALAADPFPARSITMLVPFPAGGVTDLIARAAAQGLSKQLGQQVIIDNKGGGGGTVGATQVMRAPADGYTILMGGPGDQVNAPFLMAKPPYDAGRDFEPVGCLLRAPNVLVVNAKLPVKNVADLLQAARKDPGKLNYGSSGNGSTSHLQGELLAMTTNVDLTHVPYRGSAPAINDSIAGQVQMIFSNPATVLQHIQSGALRAIAVTSHARIPELPNVPTFREQGVALEVYSWSCIVAPAKTPVEVLDKLHAALARALEDPEVQKAIAATGGEKFATTREEAKRFLASERTLWGGVIRARKIQAD